LLLDERCEALFHDRTAVEICAAWRMGPTQARAMKPGFVLPDEIRCACEDLENEWHKCRRKGRRAEAAETRAVTHVGGFYAHVQLLRMGRPTTAKPHFLVHLSHNETRKADNLVVVSLRVLSAAEWRVAKVVARGSDNQQVATDLSISVNTVRVHLRKIFQKLGINSRGKLAFLLRQFVMLLCAYDSIQTLIFSAS
jgi:DNA-binding CsgD family transcriptional regulator